MPESAAWTNDDLVAIKCAILKKATGARVLAEELTARTVQYADAPLDQLQKLYNDIEAAIVVPGTTQATRRPMVYRSHYSKGL